MALGLLLRASVLLWVTAAHVGLFAWALFRQPAPMPPAQAALLMLSMSEHAQSIALLVDLPVGPLQQASVAQSSSAVHEQALSPSDMPEEEAMLQPEPDQLMQRSNSAVARPLRQTSAVTRSRHAAQAASASPASSASAPPRGQAASVAASADSRSASAGETADWRARVLAYLARQQGYPPAALAARIEGRLLTRVIIDRQGRVLSVHVQRSSGHAVLDQHALRAIQRRSPLPPPPEEMLAGLAMLHLNIPVEFNLRKYRASLSAAPVSR